MSLTMDEMELEEQFTPTRIALVQRWLPWIRMLRGFRMAIDYRRMLLALAAVFLWSLGDYLLSYLVTPTLPQNYDGPRALWPWKIHELYPNPLPFGTSSPKSLIDWAITGPIHVLFWPMTRVLSVARGLITPSSFSIWIYAAATTLWGLLVSVLFGGAISRMAAVDFASKGDVSIIRGFRFSQRHTLSYLGAPLITIAGLATCWIPIMIAGWIARIPVVGEILIAVLWCLLLMAGFCMTMIVIGVALGWPLMVAAISTEASDAFDGLSRAYSYLFNRPWYVVFLCLFMVIYGWILLFFVEGMVHLTNELTLAAFSTSYGEVKTPPILYEKPSTFVPLNQLTGGLSENVNFGSVARRIRNFWYAVLASIPAAFVFSFFWTMTTIIYFLLRLREDATPLNEVAIDVGENHSSTVPVVGIPASELREKKDSESNDPPPPDASTDRSDE